MLGATKENAAGFAVTAKVIGYAIVAGVEELQAMPAAFIHVVLSDQVVSGMVHAGDAIVAIVVDEVFFDHISMRIVNDDAIFVVMDFVILQGVVVGTNEPDAIIITEYRVLSDQIMGGEQ